MSPAEISKLVKSLAAELGFTSCGVSRAGFLEKEAPRLEQWLQKGFHAKMQYMENHFDKRLDPTKLVPGAKSVFSFLYNYHNPSVTFSPNSPKIASYAYGEDYHTVIKDKLFILAERLKEKTGQFNGRVFTDSAPVLERAWAEKSGIGWIGKNGLLLNKQQGSYFFLAEIICDLDAEPDAPMKDYCGSCTACIDACPTEAILPNKTLDAGKCISYLTIELKDELLSETFRGKMEQNIFGCDICQDVCPWNRFSKSHNDDKLKPIIPYQSMTSTDWLEMTEEVFGVVFEKSALKRAGLKAIKRNVRFLNGA